MESEAPLAIGPIHTQFLFTELTNLGLAFFLVLMPITTFFVLLFFFLVYAPGAYSSTITLINNCSNTVWPVMVPNSGSMSSPMTDSIALHSGQSKEHTVPLTWSGVQAWARTLCSEDSMPEFSCATGDCGSSTMECAAAGAGGLNSPATVVEITLSNTAGGLDSYRVSLAYGYNLAIKVKPRSKCTPMDCAVDLNTDCPEDHKVIGGGGEVVGCNCKEPQCWSDTSHLFNSTCPYAYNDITFNCASTDYIITFGSASLIDSTAKNNTDQGVLWMILGIVAGVLALLVGGGFAVHRFGCCNNTSVNCCNWTRGLQLFSI